MHERSRKFRYSLEPLLTKFGWEADALKVELSRVSAMVEREERRVAQIEATVRDTEQQLRDMQSGGVILVEKREQADLFLKQQHGILREARTGVARLHTLRDQVTRQLGDKSRSAKALERHKERKLAENDLNENRMTLKEEDSSWLTRLPRKR